MGLPQPSPLRVELAPGANPDDDSTWAWEDITGYVRYADGIQIEAGRRDEGAQVDTTNCGLTLNNADGRFSPHNPLGTWYGKLALNTPLRVRWQLDSDAFGVDVTGGWGFTDQQNTRWSDFGSGGVFGDDWGISGGEAFHTLPVNAAYRATYLDIGALDVEVTTTARLPLSDVTGGTVRPAGVMLRMVDISNYYRCEIEVSVAEAVSARLVKVANGQDMVLAQLDAGLTHDPAVQLRVRAQIAGQTLRMKVWADGTSEPAAWTVEATDQAYTSPGGVGIRTSVGAGNTSLPFTVFYPDFAVLVDRFVGYVTEWPTRWDRSGNDAYAPIKATGILRRLQQGSKTVHSTLFRRITSAEAANDLVAYWPLEDGKGTTLAGSPVAGVAPMKVVGFDFQADSDLLGSESLPTMGPGSSYDALAPSRKATGNWHVEFVMNMDVPTNTNNLIFIDTTGTARHISLRVTSGEIRLRGDGADRTLGPIFNDAVTPLGVFGGWIRIAVFMSESGGTVTWTVRWFPIGSDGFTFNGTFAGSAGAVKRVSLSQRGSGASTVAFGHVSVWSQSNVPWYGSGVGSSSGADTGLDGELAAERMQELSDDQGVAFRLVGNSGDSIAMGPQLAATYLQLMRDCETADGGTLYELAGGLAYVTRVERYNQPVSLALGVGKGHVAEEPEPTDDDQQLRNIFTATRPGGGSARFTDQECVDELGMYDDSGEVNVQHDDQLLDVAAWQVHLGAVDEMRWPRIGLQLARNPDLIGPWLAMRIGGRITVDHDIDQIPGVVIDLLVDGWTENISLFTWDVELNCVPASPWKVGLLDDTELGRLDTDGSDLADAASLPNMVLNANQGFEDDANLWDPAGGAAISRSTDFAHDGDGSLKIVPDGSTVNPGATSEFVAVTPGTVYLADGWFYSPGGYASNAGMQINWYTSAQVFLASSNNLDPLPAGQWTHGYVAVAAPATAAFAKLRPIMTGTAAATDVLYVDEQRFRTADQLSVFATTIGSPAWTTGPSEFPFDITAGGEVMTVTGIIDTFTDAFGRDVTNGWGTADTGQTWNTSGGSASDFLTTLGVGRVAHTNVGTRRFTFTDDVFTDVELLGQITSPTLATGAGITAGFTARFTDTNNFYSFQLLYNTTGLMRADIVRRVGGTFLTIASGPQTSKYPPGFRKWIRLRCHGTSLAMKVWDDGIGEPVAWTVTTTDSSHTSGAIGTHSVLLSGNTNTLPINIHHDNMRVITPQTFTVIRSVNGIAKAQPSGTDVRLAQPMNLSH